MTEEYIIDTSIWVDLYEDRKGYNNEPLGDYAFKLLVKIKANEKVIVLTDFLIKELETLYSVAEINGMFKPFEKITKKIIATEKQREEAKKISKERGVPAGDALHAIVARDNDLILVTRDRHFRKLEDISKHYKPEELI
ncbi:type II toxin-antitoxin system VapC family toxin [Candidatus Woesearchaeota archaeon]|nr:type II toxin-antitoxin system VapC family toxin [Candidatus Woesearchaeota archaeon]